MKPKGLFISFEGAEAVGKSTQIKRLKKRLEDEGFKVCLTREPGGTALAENLRHLLKSEEMSPLTELFLVEAGRSDHVEKVIIPRLKRGEIVLCDRFISSSIVYQGIVGGVDLKKVNEMNHLASAGLSPDLCFWFDLDGPELFRRLKQRAGNKDRFDSRSKNFHKQTLEAYRKLAKRSKKPKLIRLDAEQAEDLIHQEIYSKVMAKWLKRKSSK